VSGGGTAASVGPVVTGFAVLIFRCVIRLRHRREAVVRLPSVLLLGAPSVGQEYQAKPDEEGARP
jgi:hypothetical protein